MKAMVLRKYNQPLMLEEVEMPSHWSRRRADQREGVRRLRLECEIC